MRNPLNRLRRFFSPVDIFGGLPFEMTLPPSWFIGLPPGELPGTEDALFRAHDVRSDHVATVVVDVRDPVGGGEAYIASMMAEASEFRPDARAMLSRVSLPAGEALRSSDQEEGVDYYVVIPGGGPTFALQFKSLSHEFAERESEFDAMARSFSFKDQSESHVE